MVEEVLSGGGEVKNLWYFAYGSNLWVDQMVCRTGPIRTGDERPRRVRLPGYRLVFNKWSDSGQVFANIVQPGEEVLGVIYRCSAEAMRRLDGFEQGYERREVTVIDEGGEEVQAIAYVALPDSTVGDGTPQLEYVQRIVRGAREHGLPEEYIVAILASRLP